MTLTVIFLILVVIGFCTTVHKLATELHKDRAWNGFMLAVDIYLIVHLALKIVNGA